MTIKKTIVLASTLIIAVFFLAACAGPAGPVGPAGPAGPAGPTGPVSSASELSCTQCHNDTTLIVSKAAQFEQSTHATGEAFVRGEGASCAGCHGSEGPKARINAGLLPHDESIVAVANVSPINCRTCHNIHSTYTSGDFSLTGAEQAVAMEMTGGTFDGGAGNLCASCHQIRNVAPTVTDGIVKITSSHFGTHVSAQASMLLGEGGLGGVSGTPSAHYSTVVDTCVACHMGADEFNHTFQPDVVRCQTCHADLANFDNNGVQTEIQGMVDELTAKFVAWGLLNTDGSWKASSSAPLEVTEAVADAMWNYNFVVEDASMGVHNSAYAKALLEAALEAMK